MKHVVVYKGKPGFGGLDRYVSDEFGGTSFDPKDAITFDLKFAREYAAEYPTFDGAHENACVAQCEYRTTLHIEYL